MRKRQQVSLLQVMALRNRWETSSVILKRNYCSTAQMFQVPAKPWSSTKCEISQWQASLAQKR